MIEFSYRGFVVERRGNVVRIPSLDATVSNERQAEAAIDAALTPVLRVGDEVIWRDGFGADPPRRTRVTAIGIVERHPDDAEPVQEVPWSEVRGRRVVVTVSAGKWAYGCQIQRLEDQSP